jgi:AraC family transcriptional regulator of adaptative response / methylphosphotriester-DNA alkyltransferase methyltransferase
MLYIPYQRQEVGEKMKLTDEVMWEAASGCDEAYDGQFFYAVKTVGVYCRPSCKSRTPLRKNVLYFETSDGAQAAGFRPCKRCRPDLLGYAPLLELAHQTKSLIDTFYRERDELVEALKQLGVSPGHLAAVFKKEYGVAPLQYLNRIRAQQARKMLARTDLPVINIAGEVGFDSLSAFYSFFKRYAGTTPKTYRQENRERQVRK